MFYIVCNSIEERAGLIAHLKASHILSVFHYLSLHKSEFYHKKHDGRILQNADNFTDCLLRLPMYGNLSLVDVQERIVYTIELFYKYLKINYL